MLCAHNIPLLATLILPIHQPTDHQNNWWYFYDDKLVLNLSIFDWKGNNKVKGIYEGVDLKTVL